MSLKRIFALIGVLSISTAAVASDNTALGPVTIFQPSGAVFFVGVSAPRTTPPVCATVPNRWAVDPTNPAGQAMIAAIMSAQAQGRMIAMHGTGTCSIWGDTETVSYVDFPTL